MCACVAERFGSFTTLLMTLVGVEADAMLGGMLIVVDIGEKRRVKGVQSVVMTREGTGCPETVGMSRSWDVKRSKRSVTASNVDVHNGCMWMEAEVWYVNG